MTFSEEVSNEEWTVEKLKKMTFEELLELYKKLSPPPFEEMDGEYDGHILDTGSKLGNQLSEWLMYKTAMGIWKGKGYNPKTSSTWEGYNRFIIDGKERHHLRFGTDINVSFFDNKPILRMRYKAFKNLFALSDAIDEVRKLNDGIYLCFSSRIDENGERGQSGPFCLTGPMGKYGHDIEFYFGDEVSKPAIIPFNPKNRFKPKK